MDTRPPHAAVRSFASQCARVIQQKHIPCSRIFLASLTIDKNHMVVNFDGAATTTKLCRETNRAYDV